MENKNEKDLNRIYTEKLKAGKRLYYFDVRTSKNGDPYITITESKRTQLEDGKFKDTKHKIFIYPEDFANFSGALADAITFAAQTNQLVGTFNNNGTHAPTPAVDMDEEQPGLGISGDLQWQ